MHRVARRALLVGVASILTTPLVCRPQMAQTLRRIGFLSSESADSEGGQLAQKLVPEALKQRGYVEGANLVIEWRWANGKTADLPTLAAELVRTKVDLIVARTNLPIQAAMQATQAIPIVMLNGNFPVENGLVKALAKPGGNVTGTSYSASADVFGKHFAKSSRNWCHTRIASLCCVTRTTAVACKNRRFLRCTNALRPSLV